MDNIKSISKKLPIQDKLLMGSLVHTNYMWSNLIIEKRKSVNWVDKLYKGSVLNAFWLVFSSPIVS